MHKNKSTKNDFMNNVGIILLSQLAVKMLGLVYRMVITNIRGFGDTGNGFYSAGFQIYTLLLAISSVGIPNAISKTISEHTALGDYKGAHKIFKIALLLFAGIGLACSVLLFCLSDFLALYIIKMPGVEHTIRSLAPSIFFVCLSSVIRGYFTGLDNMKATGTSQVLEQLFKSTLTILFVIMAIGQNPEIMSAAANLATSVATILSFAYLLVFYKRNKPIFKDFNIPENSANNLSVSKLAKNILMLSVPISLGSIITAVNRVIDTATITRGIETAFAQVIPSYGNTPAIVMPTSYQLSTAATRLAGMLSKSDTLVNLPLSLNIAFSTVLVPAISRALAIGDKKEAALKVNYSFLISIMLILPCAVGYISLAHPIYMLIYPNASLGYNLLQISSFAMIFTALNQTISGSLQGLGKVYVPATGLLAGCIIKVILNIILIRIPSINIYGAAISSVVCQIVSFTICFSVLSQQLTLKMSFSKYILKPLLAASLMGILAYLIYKIVFMFIPSNIVAIAAAIIVAAIFYLFAVLKLKILNRDEIEQLPSGTTLWKLFLKLHLVSE